MFSPWFTIAPAPKNPIPVITAAATRAGSPLTTPVEAILAVEPILLPIVDKILTAKKLNKNADIGKEEREIDNIVFDLYGLTQEEREAIGYITSE